MTMNHYRICGDTAHEDHTFGKCCGHACRFLFGHDIVCGPVRCRQWSDDGKIHSTLVPYVEVVKQLAADKHVPLIDLHARSIELYEKLGKQAVLELSPMKEPDKKPNSDTPSTQAIVPDGTH